MERIALWIGRCAVYEQLYFMGDGIPVTELAKNAMNDLKLALLALYTTILQVLSRLIKIFNGAYPGEYILKNRNGINLTNSHTRQYLPQSEIHCNLPRRAQET